MNKLMYLLEVVSKRLNGRKPLFVTVYSDTVAEQIQFSKKVFFMALYFSIFSNK